MWARSKHSGFTIVELLIVIVVIAILAAITIVAFNGVQDRARASASAQSSSQAAKKIKVWQVDNEAITPTCAQFYEMLNGSTASAPTGTCAFTYKDTNYQYSAGNNGAYCLTTTVTNKSYKVTESSAPQTGGCNGHSQGGVNAIVNLSTNPSVETNISGWAGPNGATVAQSSTRAKDGTKSVLVTLPTSGSGSVGANTANGYTIPTHFQANTTYTFSVWVYVPTGTVDVRTSAQGTGTASTNCGSTGSGTTTSKDAWVRLSCQFTTAASGGFAIYVLNNAAATAGMTFYVDSVMFTEGTTLYTYADGASETWAWTNPNSPNNSTSSGLPL